jgi:hypothetical protein
MTPAQGQMVGQHYVAPSWISTLAPLVSAFAGRRVEQQADQGAKELSARQGSELSAGLQRYLQTREGTPGQTLSDSQASALMSQDQNPGQLAEPVKADPRRAVMEALTSRVPGLQAIGRLDAPTAFAPPKPPEYKEHLTQDGKLVRTDEAGNVRTLGDYGKPRDKFSDPYLGRGADGQPLLLKRNLATNEVEPVDKGVRVTATTNVNTQDTAAEAFAKKLGDVKASALQKSFETAQAASKGLDAMAAARQSLDAGIKSGAPAEIALGIAKWGKALGLSDDPAVANTEAYRATMARETLQLVKSLGSGTGISNADREFAEKASGGLITLDDKTMVRLMDVAAAAAGNTIVGHKRMLNRLGASNGGDMADLAPFDVGINLEESPGFTWSDASKSFVVKPGGAGALPAKPSTSGKGTAANPMTPEEYQQYLRAKKGGQ